MLKKCRILCIALAVGVLGLSSASADVIVGFEPTDGVIPSVGNSIMVDIVADIPESEPIAAWGLDLMVDDVGIADWTLVGIGPAWVPASSQDGDGLSALAFPSGIWGQDIVLATVEFTGYSVGTTGISMGDNYPDDLTEGFFIDPQGVAVAQYGSGSITVMPDPPSLSLLALGLLALRRR